MTKIKVLARLAGAMLLTAVPACTSPRNPAVLQPVGPAPTDQARHQTDGYLVVYSAWSNFVDQGSTPHHSRYVIAPDDRSAPREIINHVDRFDEGPIRVPLSPGSYRVKARSAHFGRVTVPVVIKPRQTTFVYLDGALHVNASSGEQATAVKLPDGEVVGWSANVADNQGK